MRGCTNAGRKLFDARREDLGTVDPDDAVPGEREECLCGTLAMISRYQEVIRWTYGVDVDADNGHPAGNAFLLGLGEVDVFGGDKGTDVP